MLCLRSRTQGFGTGLSALLVETLTGKRKLQTLLCLEWHLLLRLSAQPCVLKEHHYTIKLVLAPEVRDFSTGRDARQNPSNFTATTFCQDNEYRTLLMECKCFKESLEGIKQECVKQESNSHLRLFVQRPHPSHTPLHPKPEGPFPPLPTSLS